MSIHPTALVDSSARIAEDAEVGAYTVIGPGVEIASGCMIDHHVNVERDTSIGEGTRIWPMASLGSDPQDLKYKGEPTRLAIGARVRIREFATVNRGSGEGGGVTRVGDDCLLMAYSHVAHDCQLGKRVIMANAVNLAGHVIIEDYASLGGMVAVHQFVHIGAHCFVGGLSGVAQDLPPFTLCEGARAKTHGLNSIGLKRAGFTNETLEALKKAYRIIFRSTTPLKKAIAQAREEAPNLPEVAHFLEFIEASQRGVPR
ncbi:MAG: acyl-ACP--UDP-N-acetylglucosamine O-acyltransferase [Pseudomonadota bacterium]